MIVSADPRLVALEQGVTGSYTKDVNDFWRPLHSKEAYVDGQLSVQCYLDAICGAYAAWKAAGGLPHPIARRLYHVPYGKMARKAHRQVMAIESRGDSSYEVEVARSLELPEQIGNVYTGSLYLAFASLMNAEAGAIEGQRVAFFSYGSGCTAELFAGTVAAGAGAFARELAIDEPLRNRRRLSVAEYESIRRAENEAKPAVLSAKPDGAVAFAGVEKGCRVYSRGSA